MNLTTPARVKKWAPVGTASGQFDGLLQGMIAAISRRLEEHLRLRVQIAQYSDTIYVEMLARRFWLKTAPIYCTAVSTLVDAQNSWQVPTDPSTQLFVAADPTVTYSPLRDFNPADGSTPEDPLQYYVRLRDGQVEFDFPINYTGYRNPGAFKATYYGGLAYTLDQLALSTASHVGSVSVGQSVTGQLSGAVGTILAYAPDVSMTVQVLSGVFQVGERIQVDANNYAVYTAVGATGLPLCMAYPELVEACNMQTAWWFQRRENMGLKTMSVEGATISLERSGSLLDGVKETVEHLVRYGATY